MNKESILEMSRKENKNRDLVCKDEELSASAIAWISMAVLSLVFYIAQIYWYGNLNWGFFAIIACYNAVMHIVKGIKTSKKLIIFTGVIWLIMTVLLSVAYFGNLITTSTIR